MDSEMKFSENKLETLPFDHETLLALISREQQAKMDGGGDASFVIKGYGNEIVMKELENGTATIEQVKLYESEDEDAYIHVVLAGKGLHSVDVYIPKKTYDAQQNAGS